MTEQERNQLLRERLDAMPMGKAPDRTHYEYIQISMGQLLEMQKMIHDRDAVLRQALDAMTATMSTHGFKRDIEAAQDAVIDSIRKVLEL